ncbi:MAG TPA: peptidylprolyl isomerase [Steroidobacteraceae bacterium]|jgi:peptidyl-prolyl cis-trans isomerase C|nr:peptidylprolyl isomerase [Steroidobacteraceae bacterium]
MRNLKSALLLGAAIALGTTACTKPAEDAAKPGSAAATPAPATVVTVNGTKINQTMVDTFVQAVTGKPAAEATKEQREALLEQLVNMTLAAQAAEKDALGKDPEVQARIDLLRTQVLAEAASDKYAKAHPVSDDEVKAEYDQQVAKLPKEYKARHILVESQDAATAIIKDLEGGADFAKIAKAQSKDPGSAQNGGDLGWFSGQSMVKPFTDALTALDKGATTKTPVQTQYGWHVIQLEDSRAPEAPAFEDVKEQVKMLAQRKKLQSYLDELRKTAQVQKTS